MAKPLLLDRALNTLGLMRKPRMQASYSAGSRSRLNADWATRILSSHLEIWPNLSAMRGRSRQLVRDNGYAQRFVLLMQQNVIGPNGMTLQSVIDENDTPQHEQQNTELERAWSKWAKRVSTDGMLSLVDFAQLWMGSLVTDGEVFIRRVAGYPHNGCRYALEAIDPDLVDVNLNRPTGISGVTNFPVMMGIERDEWKRPIAYYVLDKHPSEGGQKHTRIPATEIDHSYIFARANQGRGVPFLHAAMSDLSMLGKYAEAELVGARLGACKMGFFTYKLNPDEYTAAKKNDATGQREVAAEPGAFELLPEGYDFKPFDPQHPNAAFAEFHKAMLRGVAVGGNVSYAALSGDLRDVNFSSLRQGVLDERAGYQVMQTFARDHFYVPAGCGWIPMAITAGQAHIELPPVDDPDYYADRMTFQPRGWDWVDPLKDVGADRAAIESGLSSLQESCAKRGKDWRDVLDQRAREEEYAKKLGLTLNFGATNAKSTGLQDGNSNGNGNDFEQGAND
jgi:lambda family phage portal protein